MAKKKPVYFNFKDVRENETEEKLQVQVQVVHMPSVYDKYLQIKDNNGELITAFLKDIKERDVFYEKFSSKKKIIVECTLSTDSEYGFINLIPEKVKQLSVKEEIIEEDIEDDEDVIEETVEIAPKIDLNSEEIKHVRKTLEQEIRESLHNNPINFNLIKENESLELDLSEYGINNTQIFTRKVDIDKMINSIGLDYIKNPGTTILEPTSGDGAFTTRILELRLEAFKENTIDEFLLNSLKSLSTIYSIEYELPSLEVQRNNIYTLMIKYLNEHLVTEEDKDYFNKKELKWKYLIKKIIFYNIIWGATSTEMDDDYKISESPMLGKYRSNDMPIVIKKWNIKKDLKYSFTNII